MPIKPAPSDRRAELERMTRRMAEIELAQEALASERTDVQTRLEALRRELAHCPKCGRDKSFLTDEGGVLIHVLEDTDDTELLWPSKPLYCPDCGEIFLYPGAIEATAKVPATKVARRTAVRSR